jgi:glycosyltransferase involved in cell wall biosynthesis
VCGKGALYVDPYDVSDIKAKLEQILSDRPLRDQLSINSRKNADFFKMENYTERVYEAYRKAIES